MGSSRIAGPDFIGIGMPKAGTGWLFDQLKFHPDFWMPPVKEFNYLLRERLTLKSVEKRLQKINLPNGEKKFLKLSNRRTGDARDLMFLREAGDQIGQKMDLERYVSLFRHKEGALSGDISVAYGALNPRTLALLANRLPDTKILLQVRDPIDRAWSHISMWNRAGKFDKALLEDVRAFRNFLQTTDRFGKTAFPTRIVEAWEKAAPGMPFRSFLFDDIRNEPEMARREILLYLGADPDKSSGELVAGYNKKANSDKLELSEGIRSVLIEYFREELHACARLFGGHAQDWVQRYGV
jgi:hypothetical protein